MRFRFSFAVLAAACFVFSVSSSAQITHGQKPKLPPPFATRSAGNGPDEVKAPAGWLPAAPAGFHVNIFATGFKTPRWLAVAPDGDIFVAETGADQVDILRDPRGTGRALFPTRGRDWSIAGPSV